MNSSDNCQRFKPIANSSTYRNADNSANEKSKAELIEKRNQTQTPVKYGLLTRTAAKKKKLRHEQKDNIGIKGHSDHSYRFDLAFS